MMNRRRALSLGAKAMAACAGWMSSHRASAAVRNVLTTSADAQESTSDFDTQLQADMTKLGKRVYSEEGIPMILACEDLTAKTPVAPASKAMNLAIVAAFRRYTESWQRLHPSAPAGDVAKLVELMAYRDFAGGGKDNNL